MEQRRHQKQLEAHGIEHILASIGNPTTGGKIERSFRTFTAYYPRFNDLDHSKNTTTTNLTEAYSKQ